VTHLFLTLPCGAFGEVSLGLRLALDLVRRGESVVFLAPGETAVLFRDAPVRYVPVERILMDIRGGVQRLLAAERAASLTLVDAASNYLMLAQVGEDLGFLERLDVPLLALDLWNLTESGLHWDYGIDDLAIPPAAASVPRRLVPVPIARPHAGPGAFSALPELAPPSAEERRQRRAEWGLSDQDRLVLMTTGRWQLPAQQAWKPHDRLARHVPARLAALLARLGPRVQVAHLGPAPWEAWAGWGPRYRFVGQATRDRMTGLLHAADLLLSLNQNAGSQVSAVAAGLPVVVVRHSFAGATVDEVVAAWGGPATDEQREWLASIVPVHPFRVWPLGLHGLLEPVLAGNPYVATARSVELLDEDGLLRACAELLFDPEQRADAQAAQERYCTLARAHPPPAAAFLASLE
jgi:uncharacterized protein DUF6365